jgi:hypothetical protein
MFYKWMLALLIYAFLFIGTCYVTALMFGKLAVKELRLQSSRMSDKTKALQHQFAKMLVVQV